MSQSLLMSWFISTVWNQQHALINTTISDNLIKVCMHVHTRTRMTRWSKRPSSSEDERRPRGPPGHHSYHKALQQDPRTLMKSTVYQTTPQHAKPRKPLCCFSCLNTEVMQLLELNASFFHGCLLISMNCLREKGRDTHSFPYTQLFLSL